MGVRERVQNQIAAFKVSFQYDSGGVSNFYILTRDSKLHTGNILI